MRVWLFSLCVYVEDAREHANENMTVMLIGNKSDLAAKRAVSFEVRDVINRKRRIYLHILTLARTHNRKGCVSL